MVQTGLFSDSPLLSLEQVVKQIPEGIIDGKDGKGVLLVPGIDTTAYYLGFVRSTYWKYLLSHQLPGVKGICFTPLTLETVTKDMLYSHMVQMMSIMDIHNDLPKSEPLHKPMILAISPVQEKFVLYGAPSFKKMYLTHLLTDKMDPVYQCSLPEVLLNPQPPLRSHKKH